MDSLHGFNLGSIDSLTNVVGSLASDEQIAVMIFPSTFNFIWRELDPNVAGTYLASDE
jgi:hypothetical protein